MAPSLPLHLPRPLRPSLAPPGLFSVHLPSSPMIHPSAHLHRLLGSRFWSPPPPPNCTCTRGGCRCRPDAGRPTSTVPVHGGSRGSSPALLAPCGPSGSLSFRICTTQALDTIPYCPFSSGASDLIITGSREEGYMRADPQLTVQFLPSKSFVSWKHCELKMHLIHLTYGTS